MQLRRTIALAVACGAVLCGTADAASACTLVLPLTNGVLKLSANGQRLGSDEFGGVPATVQISGSVFGSDVVTVTPPDLVSSPPGYNPAGDVRQVSYRGTGVLWSVNQPYTPLATSFPISAAAGLVVLTIDNRVEQPAGFASGTYQTRTVVTCS